MTKNEKALYWRRHVAECQASGLSGRAYAKRAGISVSGLSYWRKRMAASQEASARRDDHDAAFLPVRLGGARAPCVSIVVVWFFGSSAQSVGSQRG